MKGLGATDLHVLGYFQPSLREWIGKRFAISEKLGDTVALSA